MTWDGVVHGSAESMMTLREVEERLAEIEREQVRLFRRRAQFLGRRVARCDHCGKGTQIRRLTYIQTHYYIPPSGCTEGDYWRAGEGQFECPKCGKRVRLYNKPALVEIREHFGSIEREHKHR